MNAATGSSEKLILFIRPENDANKFIIVQPDTTLVNKIAALNLQSESFDAQTLQQSLLKMNKQVPFTKIADNYINDVINLRNKYFNNLYSLLTENIRPDNPVAILQNTIAQTSGNDITPTVIQNINTWTKKTMTLLDEIRIQYREFTTSNQFVDNKVSNRNKPSDNYKIHNDALDSIIAQHTTMIEKYNRLNRTIDNQFADALRQIFEKIKTSLTNMQSGLKDITKENYLTIYELNRQPLPQNTAEVQGLIVYIESVNKNGKFENMFKIIYSNADIEQAIEQSIEEAIKQNREQMNNKSCNSLFNKEFYNLLHESLTEWKLENLVENYTL